MKLRAASLLMALFILLSGAACGEKIEARLDFTIEELLEDYDQLWEALEENFVYLPLLEERGVDLEALRLQKRALIGERVTDLEGFANLLRELLGALKIGHLYLYLYDDDALAFFRALNPQTLRPNERALLDPQTIASTRAVCKGTEGRRVADEKEVLIRYLPDVNALYFRYPTFYLIDFKSQLVPKALASFAGVDHIIFDVTNNSGGFSLYWQGSIVSPFAEACRWERDSFLKLSPLNLWEYSGWNFQPLSEYPDSLPDFVEALGLTHFYREKTEYPLESYEGASVASDAKRWVLINENSFSAADEFASFCKATGWATLVGAATKGDGAGTDVGLVRYRLNHTGLLVYMNTAAAANQDGTLNALSGAAPDIVCKPKETPLDACLRAIKALQKD